MKPIGKKIWFAMLVLMPLLCSFSDCRAEPIFEVKTSLKRDKENNLLVRFSVEAKQPLELYLADLPWFDPPTLTFAIVPVGEGTSIKRVYIPQSPVVGNVTLEPGKIKSGDVELKYYFPDLVSENARGDLIFFWYWSYKSGSRPSAKHEDNGGALLIPCSKK